MNRVDFRGLKNLKLTGVRYSINKDIGNGYHGRGIMRVNIINSNIKNYDPRDKQSNYFCIIENNKAEIYSTDVYYLNIGDTIRIDSNKMILQFYNNFEPNEMRMSIGSHRFFKMIKNKNYQKF